VLAIKLTINPLSTTIPLNPYDEAASLLCPGGDGKNEVIEQLAIPYIVQHGFSQNYVCNNNIDTVTYLQTTPYDVYIFSVLILVSIGIVSKKRI
jgi:hypothetical protein